MEPQEQTEQSAPQNSVEDRIASLFGGTDNDQPNREPETASEAAPDDTDAAPAEEAAPVEETFEVEVDGEKFALPKKLEKAVMQERDYTQKAQQVADQRRLVEHQIAQAKVWQAEREFAQTIATEQSTLSQLDAALKQYADLKWSEMTTDEIVRYRMQMDSLKEQRATIEKQIDGKKAEFSQARQQHVSQLIKQGQEYLQKAIPGWNETVAKEVVSYAVKDGYSQEEISSIIDPRNVMTLYKAMQYDKLQSKAKPAVAQAKAIKTTPSNPMSQETKDLLNYRKAIAKHAPGSQQRQAIVKDRIAKMFGG